jgi:copper chaperone CopZ
MGCQVRAIHKTADEAALLNSAVAVLHVSGMGCGNCAQRVRNSLLGLPGVLAARVDLAEGLIRVNFTSAGTDLQQMLDAVASAGNDGRHEYRAALVEATW